MWRVVKKIISLSGDKSRSVKASIFVALVYAIFTSLTYIAVYIFFADNINNQLSLNTIYKCIIIILISLIGGSIAKTITYRLQEWASNYVSAKERLDIGDRLKRVPMGFFREKTLGEVTAILTSDLTYYENKTADVLDWVVNGIISSLISCIFLTIFNWRLGIIFTLGFVVSLVILNIMQNKSAEIVPLQKNAETTAISSTLEFIRGISVFKLFSMGGNSVNTVKKSYQQYSDTSYNLEVKLLPWSALASCCLKIAISIILLLMPYLAINNIIDIPTAIMMVVASFQIFNPIETLVTSIASIRTMETTIDRIEKIKKFPLIDEASKDIELNSFDISFNNVSFSYDNKNDVIKNVSLKIPQNTMTAIVGASGSGKTTIARLIARFWDIQSGSIEIGGIDIRKLTCDSLLRNISIVFQNVYLFNDTIEANIKYGNPNATHEEVVTASKKACCHEFIMSLPEGYNTLVGESGSHLSGGEKQRISIARAILKNAPIVLLDEATSAIDPDNEVAIQQAINELVHDKTLIIIAHRLTTIKEADQIVVMDNGSVIEKGTHNELLNNQGQYSKFWNVSQKANQWRAKAE